jgi:hypothetical protein
MEHHIHAVHLVLETRKLGDRLLKCARRSCLEPEDGSYTLGGSLDGHLPGVQPPLRDSSRNYPQWLCVIPQPRSAFRRQHRGGIGGRTHLLSAIQLLPVSVSCLHQHSLNIPQPLRVLDLTFRRNTPPSNTESKH